MKNKKIGFENIKTEKRTRDQARAFFAESGLTYSALTVKNIRRLRSIINTHMKTSCCLDGSFRCKQRGRVVASLKGVYAEIKCKSLDFEDREAVSFNRDGFIGFAGWADETNVQPILEGFEDWVRELAGSQTSV